MISGEDPEHDSSQYGRASPKIVESLLYGMPVTVLMRVRTFLAWFLYILMAWGSVKKSSQPRALVVQLVYEHLHNPYRLRDC